jgi:hypothetical protein
VRQQLNLNDNQFNTLNRAYQDAYGRYSQGVNGLNNSLTAQQRQAQMQQFATRFDSDFNRSLDNTFNDPSQRSRYNQLRLQSMGANAFNDPAIQGQLNLTPQQQTQLRQMAAQWRTQMGQFGDGTNIDPNQWNQMSSQYWDQLNSVLTPQQQQTWQQLVGQRFNFSPNAYFGSASVQGRTAAPNGAVNTRPNGAAPTGVNAGTPKTPGTPESFLYGGNSGKAGATSSGTRNTTGNQGSRQGSPNTANRGGGSTR